MTTNGSAVPMDGQSPDDAPELTDEFFTHAEFAIGGYVIRPATAIMKRLGCPKSDAQKGAFHSATGKD